MVCAFFGHRDAPETIRDRLEETTERLIMEGVDCFFVGNQGHFDAMALGILRKMRMKYVHINYQVVLAYYPVGASGEYQYYETIFPEGQELAHPRYAVYRRNRWMIGQADVVVAYVVHEWGGAAAAVSAAEKKGRKIIRLYEKSS